MQISLSAPGNLRILLQWSIFLLICEINQNLQLLQITRRHPHLHVKTLDIKCKVLHILIQEILNQTYPDIMVIRVLTNEQTQKRQLEYQQAVTH